MLPDADTRAALIALLDRYRRWRIAEQRLGKRRQGRALADPVVAHRLRRRRGGLYEWYSRQSWPYRRRIARTGCRHRTPGSGGLRRRRRPLTSGEPGGAPAESPASQRSELAPPPPAPAAPLRARHCRDKRRPGLAAGRAGERGTAK